MTDRKQRMARRQGEKSDCRFFERNVDRRYRVRPVVPGEFEGYDDDAHCIVTIGTNERGELVTTALPVRGNADIPDDDRVLSHLWGLIVENVEENGEQPFNLSLSGDMLDRLTGKEA